ncbi:helix-turn-helix domain-containing protein [Streptomyces sp. 900105755]
MRWHADWRQGSRAALKSRGAGGFPCRLSDAQTERLQTVLEAGRAAHGWMEDQRWTLARVAEVIHRLFGHRYTLREVSYLLHWLGWSHQVPARRAVERDEQAVELWRTEQWSRVRGRPSSWARGWLSSTPAECARARSARCAAGTPTTAKCTGRRERWPLSPPPAPHAGRRWRTRREQVVRRLRGEVLSEPSRTGAAGDTVYTNADDVSQLTGWGASMEGTAGEGLLLHTAVGTGGSRNSHGSLVYMGQAGLGAGVDLIPPGIPVNVTGGVSDTFVLHRFN